MAIYKLEETPDVFIAPTYYANKFVYRMVSIGGETDRRLIRNVDLRNDKLMVYGTEIQESMLQKLHESLVLRPRMGLLYVNCNGACYVFVAGKGTYRTIDNLFFDWSPFGVVVPNSVHDILRKELAEKEGAISRLKLQLSSAEADGLSTKASMETLKKEANELKEQLSSSNSELQSTKLMLELSEKQVVVLKEQVSSRKRDRDEMEMRLEAVQNQLSSVTSELQSSKSELESSNKRIKQLEDQVSWHKKENEGMKAELRKAQNELSEAQTNPIIRLFQQWFQKSSEPKGIALNGSAKAAK